MLMIPVETVNHDRDFVLVIMDKSSVDRMLEHDPAEIELSRGGGHLVNPRILLCYEEDPGKLNKFMHIKDLTGMLDYLQRGWKFRRELAGE